MKWENVSSISNNAGGIYISTVPIESVIPNHSAFYD